jgi:guanylate kinase
VLQRFPDLVVSVSATTRARRSGDEVDGCDYHFLSDEEFRDRIRRNAFLEWAEFSGHLYGTPKDDMLGHLQNGRDVILEIELEGARQVAEQFPDALLVFLKPPSLAELERRLRGRGTESEANIRRRMQRAAEELEAVEHGTWAGSRRFDYVIVNDNVKRAADELACIITRAREEDEQAHSR